jgi:two-component system, NarL family, nitrate/nitrite response regulator NarL
MAIRLVLADDHPLILEALETLLCAEEGFEILASCQTGEETLQAVRYYRPDVLILDLRLPEKNGLEVLRTLAEERLPTRTVLLTAAIEEHEVLKALRLGARGLVLKEMASRTVAQCVRKVHAGLPWLENSLVSRSLEKLALQQEGDRGREVARLLTPRELEIVRMIGRGLRNKEVATRLSISEHTVKVHLSHIYAKLGVDGRLALLRFAEDEGLI